jgi:hypothetical protein
LVVQRQTFELASPSVSALKVLQVGEHDRQVERVQQLPLQKGPGCWEQKLQELMLLALLLLHWVQQQAFAPAFSAGS